MHIVLVHVHVKTTQVEAFKSATIENASHSVLEKGIARFDVIQQTDDPTRFILVEVYRSKDAQTAHKETEHYKNWKDVVEGMLAEPRTRNEYINIYPAENGRG